jgi:hypothetical protein
MGFFYEDLATVVPAPVQYGEWGNVYGETIVPAVEMEAEWVVGNVGSADMIVPPLSIDVFWKRDGSAVQVVPAVVMSARGETQILWQAEMIVPPPNMNAFGGTTIFSGIGSSDSDDYVALSINPKVTAHATYSHFPFTAIRRYGDAYLAAAADGIYLLGGTDDDGVPIETDLLFGGTDFGSAHQHSVDSVFLNLRHEGDLLVYCVFDEEERDETEIDYLYTDPSGLHTRRAKFSSRGVRGRTIQVGLSNIGGATFEVTDLEVVFIQRKRK